MGRNLLELRVNLLSKILSQDNTCHKLTIGLLIKLHKHLLIRVTRKHRLMPKTLFSNLDKTNLPNSIAIRRILSMKKV